MIFLGICDSMDAAPAGVVPATSQELKIYRIADHRLPAEELRFHFRAARLHSAPLGAARLHSNHSRSIPPARSRT
jgi:hypothetical protein